MTPQAHTHSSVTRGVCFGEHLLLRVRRRSRLLRGRLLRSSSGWGGARRLPGHPGGLVGLLRLFKLLLELLRVLGVGKADGERRVLRLSGAVAPLGVVVALPDPRAVRARVLGEAYCGHHEEVCADLHRLLATHEQADLLGLLVLEKANVTRAPLLPELHLLLPRVRLPPEELRAHLEEDLLFVLPGGGLHLIQLDQRRELHVRLLLRRRRVVVLLAAGGRGRRRLCRSGRWCLCLLLGRLRLRRRLRHC
mmetsp:Transcript_2458/g.8113  ORF Transcript_2458/g.8113 Transcript_2458/m.8113 type:complete len:250 (-) Transcript_2458:42-791(-)